MAAPLTLTELSQDSNIKNPYDSDLLFDSVWVMCRLLEKGLSLTDEPIYAFTHHNKVIKSTAFSCSYERSKEKQKQYYKKLIKLTRSTKNQFIKAVFELKNADQKGLCQHRSSVEKWVAEVECLIPLGDSVVSQTERRIFLGEKVPTSEKIISIFEPHSDIIVKDRCVVQYGNKLNLARGISGLILDLVIEAGNPADSDRFIPMVKRQIEIYGRAPRQACVDGGYASSANLSNVQKCNLFL